MRKILFLNRKGMTIENKSAIKRALTILKQGGIVLLLKRTLYKIREQLGLNSISKNKIKKLIGEGDKPVILEIGASNGSDSEEFLRTFSNGKIFLFEPDPRNIKVLKEKFRNKKNIKIEEIAISNKKGKIKFYLSSIDGHPDKAFSSSIKKPKEHLKYFPDTKFKKEIKVKTDTLDNWTEKNKIDLIDFIWADVQGAEKEMILGGLKTLNNKTKFFYTEYSNKKLYEGEISLDEMKKLLTNFEVIKIWGQNQIYGNVLFKNKTIL